MCKTNPSDWLIPLQRIKQEIATLSKAESVWLRQRLATIRITQVALDELFCKAGGIEACTGCDGACCDGGRHHITLTNLLAYLLEGEDPPVPDFSRACPYLGKQGCLLTVPRRPYNCITFFCETLDERLDSVGRERLRSLDCKLRNEYQLIAERYPAATLRGFWIALERVGNGQLLHTIKRAVVK